MKTKTHWKKAFNSNYLSTCDISENIILTIKEVKLLEVVGVNGEKQKRNVAFFKEDYKPMVLNVGNSKIVKSFAKSKYIEDWNNVPVEIFVQDNIKAFGDLVDGLRISPVPPQMKKPDLNPKSEQWLKAVAYVKSGNAVKDIKNKYNLTKQNETLLIKQSKEDLK